MKKLDVKQEYVRDKKLKSEDVKQLLEWTTRHGELPNINEIQAILFLQAWNYQTESAKIAIRKYITFKTFCSELFLNRNPLNSPLNKVLDTMVIGMLPKKTSEGYSVFFVKTVDVNADNYHMPSMIKYMDMVISLHLHEEGSSPGVLLLCDIKSLPYDFMKLLHFEELKKLFHWFDKVLPWKFKGLHYFNLVSFMNQLLPTIKPSMSAGFKEKLFVHETFDDLFKYVPLEALPEDYGGTAESTHIIHEKIKMKILDNTDFFEWEDKQVLNIFGE